MSLLALTFSNCSLPLVTACPSSLPFSQNQEMKLATKSKWPRARALVQTKQNTVSEAQVTRKIVSHLQLSLKKCSVPSPQCVFGQNLPVVLSRYNCAQNPTTALRFALTLVPTYARVPLFLTIWDEFLRMRQGSSRSSRKLFPPTSFSLLYLFSTLTYSWP